MSSSIGLPTAPSAPVLTLDLFLLLSTYLDTQTLSHLSCTCRSLHELLAWTLKRHHIFRLVGTYLSWRERPQQPLVDFGDFSVLPRTEHPPSIFRLSRTCRTLNHALAPFLERFRVKYATILIRLWTGCGRNIELQRCLTDIGPSSASRLRWCGDYAVVRAVKMGCAPVVKVLLDYGFSTGDTLPGKNSRTPLSIAVEDNHLEIAKMLLEKGARSLRGLPVGPYLHYIYLRPRVDHMVRLLMEYGIE